MKTKRKVIRNFIYKGKRKRVEDGPIESPIASEQEASFIQMMLDFQSGCCV